MKKHRLLAIALGGAFFALITLGLGIWLFGTISQFDEVEDTNRAAQNAQRYVQEKTQQPQPAPKTNQPVQPTDQGTVKAPSGESGAAKNLPDHGGQMVATTPDGRKLELPTVKTDYDVDIRGDLATVTLKQKFSNPGEVPLNATYQFPLSEEAAVYEMIMQVEDERLRGIIKEKEEAKKTFEKAKKEGKAAALLQQHRPNLFTQDVANIMPGKDIDVTIRYVEPVEKLEGRYQMVVPLVVGPRYIPEDMSKNFLVESDGAESAGGSDDSDGEAEQAPPTHPPVAELDAPDTLDHDRVSIEVRIDGGVPVRGIESATHAITANEMTPRDHRVTLAKDRVVDNKHFVLNYDLEADDTQAGVVSYWNEEYEEGHFGVLVEPPKKPQPDQIRPREMVFLLDCSGSMRGDPMNASKTFMRHALRNLRPTDTFRIIRFSDSATEYSREPIEATDENVEEAIAHVNDLEGMGGTRMTSGINQALTVPPPEDTLRMVTFLTDGYIGNEYEIIRLIREKIGDARLFALGVGNGVNRYLLEELGHMGRGHTRYIRPGDDDLTESARGLAEKMESPVLTNIEIDWGELEPRDVVPDKIPDLYAGESVRVLGKYHQPGTYEITVKGYSGTRRMEIPIEVELAGEASDGKAVELTWARQKIGEYMRTLTTPKQMRTTELSDDQIKDIVTQMGLDHKLVTKWTSFVAVSEKVVNPHPKNSADGDVPVAQVDGVTQKGYGQRGASSPTFNTPQHNGTPEPGTLGGLLLAAGAGIAAWRRRRNEQE
ncbi:MAG: VIT domain-containing protein [Myxococcota bacterium]